MKKIIFPLLFLSLFCFSLIAPAQPGNSDFLARKSFSYTANDPNVVLDRTTADLRSVFRLYKPAFDSGTKVTKPIQVGGTPTEPTFSLAAKKCVLFICQEVEIDATIRLREVSDSCDRNYVLTADLSRSSRSLTENYASLTVNLCYDAVGDSANVRAEAYADRAPEFSSGPVSKEILKMLTLQIEPMTSALHKALQQNGGRRVRSGR